MERKHKMEQKGFDFSVQPSAVSVQQKEEKGEPKIFSVSELTRQVRDILETSYAEVWVSGEISNFKPHPNGHFYFTLKDDKAQLSAVMFRGANSRLAFKPDNGLEVICHGRLSVYEARGQYQIIIDHCEPKGIGALQLAFEQLKQKLQGEGLFDPRRKKPLPFLPARIGIVTAPTGAAIRDMLNILYRRFPPVHVVLAPVRVQGEGAAQEIAEAIRLLNTRDNIDVMIVGRGGGSIEDLWAFNEEITARAIFASKIPVISAVGHEIDFTIADFVADKRAPTPSAAAELAVPNRVDLVAGLQALRQRLSQAAIKDFPQRMMQVDALKERLSCSWQTGWDRKSEYLKRLFSNLNHLSPLNVLAQGYSVVQKEGEARAVRSAKILRPGDALKITFHEGYCLAKVEKTDIIQK